MAHLNHTDLDKLLLYKNLDKLKEERPIISYKLNLLRPDASKTAAHLATFEALDNQLFDLSRQIHQLEANAGHKKAVVQNQPDVGAADDAEDDQTRGDLKTTMGLISTLDRLNEDVTRLKISLEQKERPSGIQPTGDAQIEREAPLVAPAAANDELVVKKRKPSSKPKIAATAESLKSKLIKKEENVPKKAKQVQWAPEGYYFVKAHFRKRPKRKNKDATVQKTADKGPASYDLVAVD